MSRKQVGNNLFVFGVPLAVEPKTKDCLRSFLLDMREGEPLKQTENRTPALAGYALIHNALKLIGYPTYPSANNEV